MAEIEDYLQQKEIRPTAMRMLIYKYLAAQNIASALVDIENAFDKADRTTLYRTMKTFEKKGIVHQINDGSGTPKYAMCEQDCNCEIDNDLHLHFHCTKCGETVCLTDYKIPNVSLPKGYLAEDMNLLVKGICDKCNGKK
ncbi:transcriptional repressor [Arenibacter sp. 6A1]|uniref:Fur family transcriptional regulator n=1 Tax=Arenibacter sp. 6A1 TaxID=2720391 RepID=UPI0014450F27|nr:transcriptional repressor [Arenibacter sp. 6A1]NKI27031.1 transcriptional repressor [Arenibacter sp. 6A1]